MNILRNAQSRLTLPSFQVSIGSNVLLPGKPHTVNLLRVCNISELTMTVRRLNIDGDTDLDPSIEKDYAKLKARLTQDEPFVQTRRYIGMPAYKVTRDSMQLSPLPVGVYLAEFTTNNAAVSPERMLLRVSNLGVVYEPLPDKKVRFAVLNATTGQPVAGAKLRLKKPLFDNSGNESTQAQTYTCDANGEAIVTDNTRVGRSTYYAYTDTDKALPESHRFYNYHGNTYDNSTETQLNMFTDRAIYRPGQTVQVSAIAFTKGRERNGVLKGEKMKIVLHDTNGKKVGEANVVTDDYGTASTSFVLPTTALTGHFSMRATVGDGKARAWTGINVEEYKRPTFDISYDKLTAKYQAGDTVAVSATARTFSGMAVQGAKVRYSVVRRPALWWGYKGMRDRAQTIYTDSAMTDGSGRFTARVPMQMPDRDDDDMSRQSRFYSFDLTATVTDAGGESHDATTTVPLGDKPTALACNLGDKIERDSLRSIRFSYMNAAGQPIDGNVVFYIDDQRHTTPANTDYALSAATLTSASHLLTAYCGNDTISRHFVVFAMDDKRVATQTHDWFYASASRFAQDGSPVYVQVGSSDSVQHVLYTICSGKKMLENGVLDLKDGEVSTRRLTYTPDYGDGLLLTCTWMHGGEVYRHTATIACPKPDTRLRTSWTTFRDRLKPGQKEEWTLHIATPDGQAAKAQAMLTMYDKSLDMLRPHKWSLSTDWRIYLPSTSWQAADRNALSVYGEMAFRPLGERMLDFSRFSYPFMRAREEMFVPLAGGGRLYKHSAVYAESSNAQATDKVFYCVEELGAIDTQSSAMSKKAYAAPMDANTADSGTDAADVNAANVAVRENFAETAFFMPALETDADGNIKVKFTLPESVTTWRVLGIAHDQSMNVGQIEGETVAQKQLMVTPNVPRFVRPTDKGAITARIANLAGRHLRGTARMSLLNPETGKAVYEKSVPFSLKSDSTVAVSFAFDMTKTENDGLLICRMTAQAAGYSDGEQHYLPVLAASEMVTTAVPFTQQGEGTKTIDLKPLFTGKDAKDNRLTVEYTNNPAWLMVQTLPSVTDAVNDDAVSMATAYYVNVVGRKLMTLTPAIRQTIYQWTINADASLNSRLSDNADVKEMLLSETPWVAYAEKETDNMRRLSSFYDANTIESRCSTWLSKLQKMQQYNGSFGWWPGMSGSYNVTASVAETLARLSAMGMDDAQAGTVLRKAVEWLGGEMTRECSDMRKREKKGEKNVVPSDRAAHYLYICSLIGARKDMTLLRQNDYDYLIAHMARQNAALSICDKARAAVVMAEAGRKAEAQTLIESMRQYLVSRPGMGSYYDTPKAHYSWRNYRIPTQVAVIEALQRVQPSDTATVADMQLWLLQSKRTQGWDTPLNTVDAVSAFLAAGGTALTAAQGKPTTLKVDGKQLTGSKPTAALGYVKATREGCDMSTFTAEKHTAGTSWGAVYAQSVQPIADVTSTASGIAVERTFYKDGKRLPSLDNMHVGDRITVRIDITADRDYDFVQVSDHRAACMEPTSQLSGYRNGCYVATKDNATHFYFDTLSKGRHTVETSYYIDRTGTYRTGLCTAQCAYSPEFAGRDKSVEIVCR